MNERKANSKEDKTKIPKNKWTVWKLFFTDAFSKSLTKRGVNKKCEIRNNGNNQILIYGWHIYIYYIFPYFTLFDCQARFFADFGCLHISFSSFQTSCRRWRRFFFQSENYLGFHKLEVRVQGEFMWFLIVIFFHLPKSYFINMLQFTSYTFR